MKFTLEIDCDNAAFTGEDGDADMEVAMILRNAAERVEAGRNSGKLLDSNGNSVGKFLFTEE